MVFGTLTPIRPLRWWSGILLGAGFTLMAAAMRAGAAGLLGTEAPYLVFIAAVLLSAVIGGWPAGATAGVLGGLIVNWRFVSASDLEIHSSQPGNLVIFLLVSGLIVVVGGTMSAALRREAGLAEELALVGREYQHRVTNVLTIAQALAHQTARYSPTVADFEQKLLDRLQALARAQDLLLKEYGEPTPLPPLVDEILAPYDIAGRLDAPARPPDVRVDSSVAVALALILNELATNATKYGSLSMPRGRLRLTWSSVPHAVILTWKELQGPPVTPPRRAGFGSRLFESGFAQAGGALKLDYEPDGLQCRLTLPASKPARQPPSVRSA